MLGKQNWLYANNLELSTPLIVISSYIGISLRVLYKVLMALSLAIPNGQTMKRSIRKKDSRTSMITRINSRRQALPVEQMDATTFISAVCFCYVKDLIMRSSICKTIMFRNGYVLCYQFCYVSQKWLSWDCDVWHNRHLGLKIRVFTILVRMSNLGQMINDHPYGIISFAGSRQSCNKVHTDYVPFPLSDW